MYKKAEKEEEEEKKPPQTLGINLNNSFDVWMFGILLQTRKYLYCSLFNKIGILF